MDNGNLSQKFAVEILVDGYPVQVIRSDAYVHQLMNEQIGDAYYGFSCALQNTVVNDSAVVEARLANLGTVVGAPIVLAVSSEDASQHSDRGTIRWLGGLRFSGWISGDQEPATGNVLARAPVTRTDVTLHAPPFRIDCALLVTQDRAR